MIQVLLGEGFEEIEALSTVDYLRRAGKDIVTVSLGADKAVTGSRGITVLCDKLYEETDDNIELLILPGGLKGVDNIRRFTPCHERICYALLHAHLAAICAAPTLLAEMGLLQNRTAVCYPDMTPILTKNGVRVGKGRVEIDGNLITSVGVGSAEEFSLSLIGVLCGEKAAEQVRKDAVCR